MKPCDVRDTGQTLRTCARISELLGRIGDKWTLLVIRSLGPKPMRFNALRREIGDISQKMLAHTLRNLERDGFVTCSVTHSAPPQVDYALTALGADLLIPVCGLASWAVANTGRIDHARAAYDGRANPQLKAAE